MLKFTVVLSLVLCCAFAANAQERRPATPARPYVVKTAQDVECVEKMLAAKPGNTSEDIVAQAGMQMRVAVFHDENRVGDPIELHDGSDDIYYVLDGKATLMLGGTLDSPKEISPGEWRAKSSTGSTKVEIKKGDLIIVPRGTPHQRTSTDKKFQMILVKVFAETQPAK